MSSLQPANSPDFPLVPPFQRHLRRLLELAQAPRRRVLGLMSGTSLDGLDLALCTIEGTGAGTTLTLDAFSSVPYTPAQRARLWALTSVRQVDLEQLTLCNAWLGALHAGFVRDCLEQWGLSPHEVHLLASHGQTAFHAPDSWQFEGTTRCATLQLGDGDHLAHLSGLVTLSDLRQKMVAAGGQGAPLAPYAERLLYTGDQPRVLLNLGGIANFSWLPPRGSSAPVVSGDCGPANTLLDRTVRHAFPDGSRVMDEAGALAAQGRVHKELLRVCKDHPYFGKPCPKSTGPELFGDLFLERSLQKAGANVLSTADLLATLTRLTAETVAETLQREVSGWETCEVLVSGGGWHNRTLMAWLAELLSPARLVPVETAGIEPDAKEAVLFAVLAHETVFGGGLPSLHDPLARPSLIGKLSFPD